MNPELASRFMCDICFANFLMMTTIIIYFPFRLGSPINKSCEVTLFTNEHDDDQAAIWITQELIVFTESRIQDNIKHCS